MERKLREPLTDEELERFEGYAAAIFSRMGMDLNAIEDGLEYGRKPRRLETAKAKSKLTQAAVLSGHPIELLEVDPDT